MSWDAARKTYRQLQQQSNGNNNQNSSQNANNSIHQICGQSIELVLKASVASRTLDNITGVLISFKNFRKTLKNEQATGEAPRNTTVKNAEMYRQNHLNMQLAFPNGDLTWEDVEKPLPVNDPSTKSDISITDQQKQYPNQLPNSLHNKMGGSGLPNHKDSS